MAGLVPAISFCPRPSCHRDEVIAHTVSMFHLTRVLMRCLRIILQKNSSQRATCVPAFKPSVISLILVLQIEALDAGAAYWRPRIVFIMESVMPVAQKAVVVANSPREFIVRHVAMFAAAALFVFVLSLTYGLDLSPGFF